jgi:hypothetical protein
METLFRLCVNEITRNSINPTKFVIDPCTVNRQDRLIVIAILIESKEVIIANWAN